MCLSRPVQHDLVGKHLVVKFRNVYRTVVVIVSLRDLVFLFDRSYKRRVIELCSRHGGLGASSVFSVIHWLGRKKRRQQDIIRVYTRVRYTLPSSRMIPIYVAGTKGPFTMYRSLLHRSSTRIVAFRAIRMSLPKLYSRKVRDPHPRRSF